MNKSVVSDKQTSFRRLARRMLLVIAGGIIVAAGAAPAPALADGGRGRGHEYRREHRHGHGPGQVAPQARRFVVPNRIHTREVAIYRPWYGGRAYFRPHHHSHVIYRFPVYTSVGVIYQPYSYCDGEVFFDARVADGGYRRRGDNVDGFFAYSGRNFGIAIGF